MSALDFLCRRKGSQDTAQAGLELIMEARLAWNSQQHHYLTLPNAGMNHEPLRSARIIFWLALKRGLAHVGTGPPQQERCLRWPAVPRKRSVALPAPPWITCRDWSPPLRSSSSRCGSGRPRPAGFSLWRVLVPAPQPAAATAPPTQPWLGPRQPPLPAWASAAAAPRCSAGPTKCRWTRHSLPDPNSRERASRHPS